MQFNLSAYCAYWPVGPRTGASPIKRYGASLLAALALLARFGRKRVPRNPFKPSRQSGNSCDVITVLELGSC
eukprot:1086127-Amphidinium_carterae.1